MGVNDALENCVDAVCAGVFQFRGNQATVFEFAVTSLLSLKNTELRLQKFGSPNFPLCRSGRF
jgi:hypothetical protein